MFKNKFQKICGIILAILIAFTMSLDLLMYRAFLANPSSLSVIYKTISSSSIPSSMNQVSAVYITDLEYGPFSDQSHVQSIFQTIQDLNPDIFLFGGDLFASDAIIDETAKKQMIQWLSAIEAPLGKFAVLGEQDLTSQVRLEYIQDIYSQSQIEILDNTSLLLANQSRQGIRLVGLSVDASPEQACQSLSSEQFNLLITHYPDNLTSDALAIQPVSLALAGNAHGTQITWPITGGYREWAGSTRLNRASQKTLSFDYYLSSGLGCINVDARLNAPVEIVYLLFSST